MDNNAKNPHLILDNEAKKQYERAAQKPPAGEKFLPITLPYARVLVVDDVQINLEIAMGMMQHYKMQIDGVTSGREAIDAIRDEKQKYDVIFMDHFMPDLDGIETVKIIRQEIGTEYAKNIPIIALTAEINEDSEKMFLNSGFQAFLPKPINMARLDAILRKWVQDKEKEAIANEKTHPEDQCSGTDSRKGYERQMILGKVEGLDMEKGRERFGGNTEVYLQVLRSFNVNTPLLIKAIREVREDTLADYAITVHGIKGSCWGIWAEPAGELAANLEKAAKAGDFNYVAANNRPLIEMLSKLVENITAVLHMETPREKPQKDKPDREALSKILAACKNYNITEATAAIKELEQFEYTSDGELVSWLRENAEQMNSLEIVERLTGLLEAAAQ
ncbi:MAG: response regulator [Treponema sp.]|nr:response regulator [Treponema sp.]